MSNTLRVSAVQLNSGADLSENLKKCEHWVEKASDEGAELVVLPENFAYFGPELGKCEHAEDLAGPAGPIRQFLSTLAKRHNLYLLGGGWPERSSSEKQPYNAASLMGPDGRLIAHYRKMHLFDVTLPNGTMLKESASTTAGNEPVVADVLGVRVGLTICYDLRFPELYRALVNCGANLLCVPSAFTLETGKDHWHLLNRARAVESQCWVVAANQWGSHGRGRSTYGHSMIIDPWGTVVAEASDREGVIVGDVDLDWLEQIRTRLPCLSHRRIGCEEKSLGD